MPGICRGAIAPGWTPNVKERHMCSPAPCRQCGKVTWSGCGEHIEEALANVPPAQRCTCR